MGLVMALDRFVRFKKERPTRNEVESVLKNFMGEAGTIRWDQDRFFIEVPGHPSYPFINIVKNDTFGEITTDYYHPDGRWIELFVNDEQFDVITREQDEFTNVIAAGIAKMFARFWEGEVEE